MARYLITAPAFVGGTYYPAAVSDQREITIPDEIEPSRTWKPLDKAAHAAMSRLTGKATEEAEPEPEEDQFKCPQCDFIAKSAAGLKTHLAAHGR